MTLTAEQALNRLIRLGWGESIRRGDGYAVALADFQRGWNLGQHVTYRGASLGVLLVDGRLGPRTSAALEFSQERRLAGLPTASNHFDFAEFCCKGPAGDVGCRRVRVLNAQLHGLEVYRRRLVELKRLPAHGLRIASPYRCQRHNARVGGASSSQHLYGAGSDVEPLVTVREVARLRLFSGIGYNRSSGKVSHVDVRHLSGVNPNGGTPDRPIVWPYAR